jgi:hypothetical protein
MSQTFRQSANILSKVSIFGVLALVGGIVLLAIVLGRSTYVTRAHEFIEQPLQFSHMHHVTDDGIDCRFANASFLEPVRASFRDDRHLVDAEARERSPLV